MQLHCRVCAAEIPAANINLDNLVAKCANCNAVYGIAGELGMASGGKDKATAIRAEVPMPQGIEIKDEFDKLVIRREWFSWKIFTMVGITLVVDFVIVATFVGAAETFQPILVLVMLPFVAVALVLTYLSLASFVNITTITVTPQEIDVRHRPLPMLGLQTLPASHLAQLYCVQKAAYYVNNRPVYAYDVCAILNNQRRESLLTGLDSIEQALYIEQEIERYLQIEHRPVPGGIERY